MIKTHVILKRGLFYRPDAAGYTGIRDEAGLYTFQEAWDHSHPNGDDGQRDGINFCEVHNAPEYSSGCCQIAKAQHKSKPTT